MSYLVIARKWRPQTFEDVVGQSHVTRTLQNAISAGRVAHAYLFTGPRGVGKTSTARILAKALNCEKGPTPHPCLACPACLEIAGPGSVDVAEIDGASNNSVDDIRSLREKVQYTGVRDRHKVYIIDEVHMLSGAAFNALLKTLEEPPAHVVFIFATTEANKVPATILSRTQRFDFRRVGAAELAAQLGRILKAEGLDATPEALQLVARAGEGSVRDSQTLLDQVISFALGAGERKALQAEDVLAVLGGVQEGQVWGALKAALRGDSAAALGWIQEQYQRGADLRQVLDGFQNLLRGLLLLKAAPGAPLEVDVLPETAVALEAEIHSLGLSRLFSALKACEEAQQQMRHTSQLRLILEMLVVRIAPASPSAGLGEIVDELRDLERRFREAPAQGLAAPTVSAAGTPAPASAPAPVQASAPASAPVPVQASAPASAPAPAPLPAVAATPEAPVPAASSAPQGAAPSFAAPTEAPSAPAPAGTSSAPLVSSVTGPAPVRVEAPLAQALEDSSALGTAEGAPLPEDAGEPALGLELEEPAAPPAVSLERLREGWEALVNSIQAESLSLASAAKDAGLVSWDKGVLTLRAVNTFQRKVLDDPLECARLVRLLKAAFGCDFRVKVLFEPPQAKGAKAGGRPSDEAVQKLLKERPEVRRVQELFGAEIVEIRED